MRHVGGPFNTVGGLKPRRHFFDLSHETVFTCKMGQLYPIVHLETLPGDKFKIGNNVVVRLQPTIAPILQEIRLYIEYFFVPFRLLWDQWPDFISGGKEGTFSGTPPLYNDAHVPSVFPWEWQTPTVGTLWDALGYPVDVTLRGGPSGHSVPNAWYQLAYNLIFNWYYRDQTLDDEVDQFNDQLLYRRRKKDYFTSALLFQQRGAAQAVPVTLDSITGADVYSSGFTSDVLFTSGRPLGSSSSARPNPTLYMDESGGTRSWVVPAPDGVQGARFGAADSHSVYDAQAYTHAGVKLGSLDFTGSGGFSVTDLRAAVQVQKFLERNARAGYRLAELDLAHFGIAPLDAVLQKPQYIGRLTAPIVVSEVLQTSQTTSGSSASPQGNLAGRGLGVASKYIATFTAPERGVLMGLLSVMPTEIYDSQGIGKDSTRRDRYDYYWPEFAHLSEQPILKREIMAGEYLDSAGVMTTKDFETFGFQPIFQEYRHIRSFVTGKMRPSVSGSLGYWTMARSFEFGTAGSGVPALDSDFIAANYDTEEARVFAVNSEDSLMISCGNILKSIRPIPVLGDPGLVDHF